MNLKKILSVAVFFYTYVNKLFKMVGSNKWIVIYTFLILMINSIIEAIFTFGIIGFTADYFESSNQLPLLFDQIISRTFNLFNSYLNVSKDVLIVSFLFIILILRQFFLGLQNTFIHIMNTRLFANIRSVVVSNLYIKKSYNPHEDSHGAVEQIISQDAKLAGQTIILLFHFINSLFFILCMTIIMIYISKKLFLISLLFATIFIPFKFLYTRSIVASANNSKAIEYNVMKYLRSILENEHFEDSKNTISYLKIKNKIYETSRKEAFFRILMAWETSIIHLMGLLFFMIVLYLAITFNISNTTQIAAFFFVIYRLMPFLTKGSKHLNSFLARRELVSRTYNFYSRIS